MAKTNAPIQLPQRSRLFAQGRRYRKSSVAEELVDDHGKLHKRCAPALRFDDGGEEWWTEGRLQSQDDGPALFVERSNAGMFKVVSYRDCHAHEKLLLTPHTQVWCDDGYIHRIGAAAVINDGDEEAAFSEWWEGGLRHRVGAPAVERYGENLWFERGLLHRLDGPAVEYKNCPKELEATFCQWYWRGNNMVSGGSFDPNFDYAVPPPKFVLAALGYLYEHFGWREVCQAALTRACVAFPSLGDVTGVALGISPDVTTAGKLIERYIRDVLDECATDSNAPRSKAIEEWSLSVEGMFDEA